MAPRLHSLGWAALLSSLLLVGARASDHAVHPSVQPACGSGAADSCELKPETTGPDVHVEDGLLTEELRNELIQARKGRCGGCQALATAA